MEIKNIILVSDLLASGGATQRSEPLLRAEYFFQRPLQQASEFPVEIVHAHDTARFDAQKFYALCGLERLGGEAYAPVALEYAKACFEGCFVIAVEAGAAGRMLAHAGIPHMEMTISPIRFLEDLHYAFRTNLPPVQERLLSYRLPEEALYANAQRVMLYYESEGLAQRINYRYGSEDPLLAIPPGSLLFCGQESTDNALLVEDKPMRAVAFQAQLDALFARFPRVYYNRRPGGVYDAQEEALLLSYKHVQQTGMSIYRLLSMENITTVAAISADILTEATYFGKKPHALAHVQKKHYDGIGKPDPDSWITLDSVYFSPAFWADVLQDVLHTAKNVQPISFYSAEVLRSTAGGDAEYEVGRENKLAIFALQQKLAALEAQAGSLSSLGERLGLREEARKAGTTTAARLGIQRDVAELKTHWRVLLRLFRPENLPLLLFSCVMLLVVVFGWDYIRAAFTILVAITAPR